MFRSLYQTLLTNKTITSGNETIVIESFRELAEMVVYGDTKSELLFEYVFFFLSYLIIT